MNTFFRIHVYLSSNFAYNSFKCGKCVKNVDFFKNWQIWNSRKPNVPNLELSYKQVYTRLFLLFMSFLFIDNDSRQLKLVQPQDFVMKN